MLLTGLVNQDGEEYYAFYAIRADITALFLKKLSQSKLDIEEYGVILETFPGKPSENILNMVKENFGQNAVL